jgi:hypothetical protein
MDGLLKGAKKDKIEVVKTGVFIVFKKKSILILNNRTQ